MWYRKPVGRITTTYYKKKFDWIYVIGSIVGGLALFAYFG